MQVRHPMISLHKLSLLLKRPKPIPALDMADDRLSDDPIVPEQFSRPPDIAAKACREAALMQAVLAEAVSCFQRGTVLKGRRAQRLAKDAEEWFFANDQLWPFSFVNICEVLGLDPEYIRLGLKLWRQHPPAAQKKQRRALPARQQLRLSA